MATCLLKHWHWLAEDIDFEKLVLKGGIMNDYFFKFGKVLRYVQKNARATRLREEKQRQIITVADCGSIEKAKEVWANGVKQITCLQS